MARTSSIISSRLTALQERLRPLHDFLNHSEHARRSGDPTIADAVLDRLVHNDHRLLLKGESLRKRAAKALLLDAEAVA